MKLIIITGPTATGKTALGVELALHHGGEVVSADSMQIYKHMDIGTAKPAADEMMGVPHHMIDIAEPFDHYSAARYAVDAAACVDDIIRRGKLPVIVGGTGLYIDALIRGADFSPTDDTVRGALSDEYDAVGGDAMLERLRLRDPESAARLHSNDKKRIVRALEIYTLTGETITEHDRRTKLGPPRYDAARVALTFTDRQTLYDRIDKRVDLMMERGLVSEVRGLLGMGLTRRHTAMQAIGYKELATAIEGECGIDEAVDKIKMESRRYAKRQLSWLRRDAGLRWITWESVPDTGRARALLQALTEIEI